MKVFSNLVKHASKVHRKMVVKRCAKEAVVKYEKALRKLAYH